MYFKLLNDVFHAKTFYMKVALKYQINIFVKFAIIKNPINHMLVPLYFT